MRYNQVILRGKNIYTMEKYRIALYATVSSALWGTSFPLTKMGLEEISPLIFAFFRYLLASIFFIILSLFYKNFYKINAKNFVILGLLSVTLPTVFQNVGLQYTQAHITGFLQSTGPLYTVILASVFLKEKINIYKIFGIFIGLIGLYFIITPGGGGNFYGNMLVLLSAVCYSIGGIIAKNLLNRGIKPMQVVAFSSIFGTIFLFPLTFFEKVGINAESYKYILFLAIFTTFLAYFLWYSAMEKIEVSKLSFYVYLIPLFSLIFSRILIGEELRFLTILAGFVVVAGVAIAQKA
ncbi:MAG TPA: DMT family transporter [Thermoplasmatales archaeon]|nr:DMT family transporter [Thermoplasmatales archaeon]